MVDLKNDVDKTFQTSLVKHDSAALIELDRLDAIQQLISVEEN